MTASSRSAAFTTATSSGRASDGRSIPVASVKQNNVMRMIILVPISMSPMLKFAVQPTIRVNTLQARAFEGKIAPLCQDSENEQKVMRTRSTYPNPDNLLRDGMYGTARLRLEPPSDNLTVPSSSLIEQDSEGHGAVYMVKEGKAHGQPVRVDLGSGDLVESSTGSPVR